MRTCVVCGFSLEGRRPQAIYCSDGCRSANRDRDRAARRFSPTRPPCAVCGASMIGRREGAIYCSPSCRAKAWTVARGGNGEGDDTDAVAERVQKRLSDRASSVLGRSGPVERSIDE
jgi:hypothetical protein